MSRSCISVRVRVCVCVRVRQETVLAFSPRVPLGVFEEMIDFSKTVTIGLWVLALFPLSTSPLPSPPSNIAAPPTAPPHKDTATGAGAVPLYKPSSDFATSPNDLWFCRDRNFCNRNGRCDLSTGSCICDHPWYGEECAHAVVNAEISGNDVHVSLLNPNASPSSIDQKRAEGNELFLAKAHHRLRQVVAELSLSSDGCQEDAALCREKKRLMRMLGMQYMSAEQEAPEFKTSQDPAKVAAQFMSNLGLPAVSTMRWNNPVVPDEKVIVRAVQSSVKATLRDSLEGKQQGGHEDGKWLHDKSVPFAVSTYREHKSEVPGISVLFSGEGDKNQALRHVRELSLALGSGAQNVEIDKKISGLEKVLNDNDDESDVNKRIADLKEILQQEERAKLENTKGMDHESVLVERINNLADIVGVDDSESEIAKSLSDLKSIAKGHSDPDKVEHALDKLKKVVGYVDTAHGDGTLGNVDVNDAIEAVEEVVGNNDPNSKISQRVQHLETLEKEYETMEQGNKNQMAALLPESSGDKDGDKATLSSKQQDIESAFEGLKLRAMKNLEMAVISKKNSKTHSKKRGKRRVKGALLL